MPVGFTADGRLLVRDGDQIDIWDVEKGELVSSSPEGATAIWTVEIGEVAGNGPLVALREGGGHGLHAGPVSIWNAATGGELARLPDVGRIPYAAALPLSQAAELFACPDPVQQYAIRLFDLRLKEFRRPLLSPGSSDQSLLFGRFNRSGTVLAAQEGGLNSGVRLWNVETGVSLAYLHDHENPVWSPDGRYLAVAGPGRFQLPEGHSQWGNRAALVVYEVVPPTTAATVSSRPSAIAFSVDGEKMAVQGSQFEVVDRGAGRRLRPIATEMSESKQGKFVATGGGIWRFDHIASLQPSEKIRIEQVFPQYREVLLDGVERQEVGSVQDLAVSPDGKFLLLEWQRQVPIDDRPNARQMVHQLELWDLSTGMRTSVWEPRPRRTVSWGVLRFSADGQLAVTSEAGFIFVRDVHTGEVIGEARLETVLEARPDHTHTKIHTIADVAFAADGRFLICGGQDGRIGVVDVATGEIEAAWNGHDGDVTALAVSPDGHTLATTGEDRTIRLWELGTQRELARWEPHQNSVTAIQFSPDGRSLATASSDGTVRLWDLLEIRKQLAAIELDW
jgi:WD40 repeat protein